jgi:hypothetical protein
MPQLRASTRVPCAVEKAGDRQSDDDSRRRGLWRLSDLTDGLTASALGTTISQGERDENACSRRLIIRRRMNGFRPSRDCF